MHVPEGFSPNGDGVNDTYVIQDIEYYPNNHFVVFNRWGNKVYEANPYDNSWHGQSEASFSFGGTDLPAGIYFYTLDLGDGSPIIKGYVYMNK